MDEPIESATSGTSIALGYDSFISAAKLTGYRISTPAGGTDRVRIRDCELTDCDLSLADWANFENCTFVRGKLPRFGDRDEALNCTVTTADPASVAVAR